MTDQHLAVIVLAALIAGVLVGMAIGLTVRYYIHSKKRGQR